jgi:hypothetical protein
MPPSFTACSTASGARRKMLPRIPEWLSDRVGGFECGGARQNADGNAGGSAAIVAGTSGDMSPILMINMYRFKGNEHDDD